MKKTHKKLLGFAGLVLVVAMTVFAAFLPGPGALATNSSVTDTIIVRVISNAPNVEITNPESGKIFINPNQKISYTYENVNTATITLKYTDLDGNVRTDTLESFSPGGQAGSGDYLLDLDNYGYGDFVITFTGIGSNNIKDEDSVSFSYSPVVGDPRQIDDTGTVELTLDYDETNDDIEYIEINVYDKNKKLIQSLSPARVKRPQKTVDFDFGKFDLPSGKYIFEITAFDENNTALYIPYFANLDYVAPEKKKDDPEPVPVPNTGSITDGTGISQSDYIISGLIVFFLAGICGIIVIGKNRQDKKRR